MTAYFYDYYNAALNGYYPGVNYGFPYTEGNNAGYSVLGQTAYTNLPNISNADHNYCGAVGTPDVSSENLNSFAAISRNGQDSSVVPANTWYEFGIQNNLINDSSASAFNSTDGTHLWYDKFFQTGNGNFTLNSEDKNGLKRSFSEAGFYEEEDGCSVPLPEELLKMFKPLECELCNVVVASEVTAYAHYNGKTHSKSINNYMREHYSLYGSVKKSKIPFQAIRCDVCNVDCGSLIQAQQHFNGKVHKKNLKKVQYVAPVNADTPLGFEFSDLSDDSNLLKNIPPPPPPPKLSDFICEICNIAANTEHQLIVHKNGSRHKRKVKKLQEENNINGTDGISYYVSDFPSAEDYLNEDGEPVWEGANGDQEYADNMPLANEPLQFGETNPQIGLCIKWYSNKEDVPPEREMEQVYQEIFNKECRSPLIPPVPPNSPVYIPPKPVIPPKPPETLTVEHEAPLGVEIIPPFSMASVIMKLSNISADKTESQPPDPTLIAMSLITSKLNDEISKLKNETDSKQNEKNKKSNPTSEIDQLKKDSIKPGKFISTNWITTDPKEEESNSLSNQTKKKSGTNFLTGFKKYLKSKKREENSMENIKIENLKNKKKENETIIKKNNDEIKNTPNSKKENKLGQVSPVKTIDSQKPGNSKKEESLSKDHKQSSNKSHKCNYDREDSRNERKEENRFFQRPEKYDERKSFSTRRSSSIDRKGDKNSFSYKYAKENKGGKWHSKNSNRYIYEYRHKNGSYSRYDKKDDRHIKSHSKKKKHRNRSTSSSSSCSDSLGSEDSKSGYRRENKRHHRSKENLSHNEPKTSNKLIKKEAEVTLKVEQLLNYLAPVSRPDQNDLAMYRTPSGLYYCVTCDYKSTSKTEFTQHLHCDDHRQKRKKAERR